VVLPPDPDGLREWALVMALAGILNGIDRNLIPDRADVVVHGSGSYAVGDFVPVDPSHTTPIRSPGDMAETVFASIER
jgi:hypothetical protein